MEGDEGGLALGFSHAAFQPCAVLSSGPVWQGGDNRDKELNPFLWVQSFGAGWKRARLLGTHSSRSGMGLWLHTRTSAPEPAGVHARKHVHTHTHTQQSAGLND